MSGIRERSGEAATALARTFRNPDLRRLQLAWLGSVVGHWSYVVALSVYAFGQGGAAAVGLVWVIRLIPAAVLSPVLATIADRFARERVMIATDLVRALLMAAATVLIAVDGPAPAVYAVAVAATVIGVVFRPAQAALLPQLARDPSELTAANVASSTIESVASFAGPALGGLLLAATSTEIVFAVNGASFVWSAALVLGISVPADGRGGAVKERPGFVRELTGGVGAIVHSRQVGTVALLYGSQTLVAGAMNVLVVVLALDLLDAGEAGVGYLNGMIGVGGIVGGFVALVLATRRRLAADFGVGLALFGLPLVAVGVVTEIPVALLAFAVLGVGNAMVDVTALTLLQRIVPNDVLGRVLGTLEGALLGAIGLGALLTPLLIEVVGTEATLVIAGAVLPALALLSAGVLRRIDQTQQAPAHTELLRGVPLFAPLPEPVLEHLAASLEEVRHPAGTAVITLGEHGDRFYVISEGEVEIEGRRFGPGESFGEIALLRDVLRTATVTAAGDVVLQALERDEFLAAVTGHESARAAADEVVAARLGRLESGLPPI
ncbi:MAG: MFS transporter [Thermoleophilia bacterium]|nr:MFS transporter [Thermoleophilia bacterium]MDH4345484.1 MFS transporter [Thermoleophilia bacterium]